MLDRALIRRPGCPVFRAASRPPLPCVGAPEGAPDCTLAPGATGVELVGLVRDLPKNLCNEAGAVATALEVRCSCAASAECARSHCDAT